jgi:hypothetical protein
MKRVLTAIALAFALCVSALAGDIPTSGSPAPPPSGTTQTTTTTSPSDIPTSGSAEQVSDTALSALLTVLGFLAV